MICRLLMASFLAAMMCVGSAISALAQTFPSGTVFIIVPYPAGGSTDALARVIANDLSKLWKQSVIVENLGGASSIIGTRKVVESAPDGHTLLLTIDSTVVSNRFLYKNLPYDPDKSLIPITMLAKSGQLVIANPSFPAKNLREIIDTARRTSGGVTYASYGVGTQPNLLFETLAKKENVHFLQVPYKGIAPSVNAVVAGEVQVSVASPAASGTLVKAGKIKALAVGGSKRSNLFPNVPTLAESGYPDVDSVIWWGLFAPKGTSSRVVDQINRDVISVAKQPDFIKKYFTAFGLDPVLDTPAEFTAAIRSNVDLTGRMVKAAGVKPIQN
jgi:tripartite-type tricarboxylate transporter receptor subunit TctC